MKETAAVCIDENLYGMGGASFSRSVRELAIEGQLNKENGIMKTFLSKARSFQWNGAHLFQKKKGPSGFLLSFNRRHIFGERT